jgi:hypothetical protein
MDHKNKETSKFSGSLASRIEWKLLEKFQTFSLVPPSYKQAMILQNKKEIDQLGIIAYIKTEGTSSYCPHCSKHKIDKSEKFNNHSYKCINLNCNFDSSDITKRNGLIGLDNSDSVATFNIAKYGLQSMISKNLEN